MERVGVADVEAQDKHIGIRIRQRTDGVVEAAARCVPDRVLDGQVVDKISRGVFLEIRWNICLESNKQRDVIN